MISAILDTLLLNLPSYQETVNLTVKRLISVCVSTVRCNDLPGNCYFDCDKAYLRMC